MQQLLLYERVILPLPKFITYRKSEIEVHSTTPLSINVGTRSRDHPSSARDQEKPLVAKRERRIRLVVKWLFYGQNPVLNIFPPRNSDK